MPENYTYNDVDNPVLVLACSGLLTKEAKVNICFSKTETPPMVNLWVFFEGGMPNSQWAGLTDKVRAEYICSATSADYREMVASIEADLPKVEFKGNENNMAMFTINPDKVMVFD